MNESRCLKLSCCLNLEITFPDILAVNVGSDACWELELLLITYRYDEGKKVFSFGEVEKSK